ncbi:MAG: site-2 protease family protein [Bacillota bacterium]|nr:hypothetical protein [Clostridia bacterium]
MKIGQVRGINLKVSRFLPALFLIYFLLGIGDKALLVFAIILIHELGHVFCAVFWGMRVDTFELFPLGGVARMENLYVGSLGKEIVLYLTGPLVNFFLGGVCFALCFYLKEKETMAFLGQASLAIGLFNLIPAWPLDGGRIFQAILSRLAGYLYAARFVSLIGQLWAVIFFIYGVWAMAYSPVNLHWWIIAVFLFYLNKREKGIVYLSFMHYLTQKKKEIEGGEFLPALILVSLPKVTVIKIIERLVPHRYHLIYVLDAQGRIIGLITEDTIIDLFFQGRMHISLGEVFKK